jgi:hypothetical protein
MRGGIPILAVLLAACDSPTKGSGELVLSRGPCELIAFEALDSVYNMRLGPELQGSFTVNTIGPGDTLHGWAGESNGLQARRTAIRGQPSTTPLPWVWVVPPGSYAGTLKVRGDSILWSFDDDRGDPGRVDWMSFQPWHLEGPRIVARWGNYDSLGWSLSADMICRN